jgi:hypothetical protein
MTLDNPILREAAGLDPNVGEALAAGDFLEAPRYSFDFRSPRWPVLEGAVVLRYATVGDTLQIERLAGSGRFSEAIATLMVLVEKAPGAWYKMPESGGTPSLDLLRIPDAEGIVDLYRGYSIWREDFRTTGASR